ncbi:uncharacterized protein EDB93DRAFT_1251941 [Suillus bovinus]|uniref:uncharacterized protein n=1 Tax=Suillus bovinus TaxID=48563 RepID=UPI001B87173F|nr:uncharacterized protein EDB93DRAFT_1251941 [Suillus bovinus]KAG2143524.1 hypothetical protein EDB93DRAFT_1251941 [Suillus bovinus]
MNSFKKIFQKSNDDQNASLKHSRPMPYGLSSEKRKCEPLRDDSSKRAYRGKTLLKKSDIVYVEQAPGMLEVYHGKLLQHTYYHGPTHANSDPHADLLPKFPHSPEQTEGLPRSGFRALSLNSKNLRCQVSIHNLDAGSRQAYLPISHRNQRQEERIRTKSSAGRSNIPPPSIPVPPVPNPHSLHPALSRLPHSSRVNIREVPSHVAVPQTSWAYSKY